MSFAELVQALGELDRSTEPREVEQTIARAKIDRRLMRLLSAESGLTGDERRAGVRVAGELAVKLTAAERSYVAKIVDLSEGGLRVRLTEMVPSDVEQVETELIGGGDDPPAARAKIAWRTDVELGLKFVSQPDAHKRRMRRLVLDILRHMPH